MRKAGLALVIVLLAGLVLNHVGAQIIGGGGSSGGGGGGAPTGAAGGDLNGTYPNPGVAQINGYPVVNATPVAGCAVQGTGTSYNCLPTPTVVATPTLPLSGANGGTGNALQYVVNDRGTTTTPACDFSLGYICRWTAATAATLSVSNIPGSTTNPITVRTIFASTGVDIGFTLPATMMIPGIGITQWSGSASQIRVETQGGNVVSNNEFTWSCNGTNCFLVSSPGVGVFAHVFVSTDITNASATGSAMRMTGGGLLSFSGGTAPTLTAGCNGAGSSVTAGSTDNAGTFVSQTAAATTCTLTFNHLFPQAPHCGCWDANASTTPVGCSDDKANTTTSVAVFDFASTASRTWNYLCF